MRIRTRRWMTGLVVTLGLTAASLLAAAPASADEHPDCILFAYPPVYNFTDNIVSGQGIRDGCVQNRRDVTVRIREDISAWPDRTVAQTTVHNVVNVSIFAVWRDCSFGEGGRFFTEIFTNAGGSAQSSRVNITCLNPG